MNEMVALPSGRWTITVVFDIVSASDTGGTSPRFDLWNNSPEFAGDLMDSFPLSYADGQLLGSGIVTVPGGDTWYGRPDFDFLTAESTVRFEAGSTITVVGPCEPEVVPCDCVPVSGDPASGGGWAINAPLTVGQDTWQLVDMTEVVDPSLSGEGEWWQFVDGGVELIYPVQGLTTDFIADVGHPGEGWAGVAVDGDTNPLLATAGTTTHVAPPSGDYPAGTRFELYGQITSGSSTTIWPAWTFQVSCYEFCPGD